MLTRRVLMLSRPAFARWPCMLLEEVNSAAGLPTSVCFIQIPPVPSQKYFIAARASWTSQRQANAVFQVTRFDVGRAIVRYIRFYRFANCRNFGDGCYACSCADYLFYPASNERRPLPGCAVLTVIQHQNFFVGYHAAIIRFLSGAW